MNQHYFNFYDIPDLILKKNYSRSEYEEKILKLLKKVKEIFINMKQKENPDKQIQITDDDLIPLDLFDKAITQIKYK